MFTQKTIFIPFSSFWLIEICLWIAGDILFASITAMDQTVHHGAHVKSKSSTACALSWLTRNENIWSFEDVTCFYFPSHLLFHSILLDCMIPGLLNHEHTNMSMLTSHFSQWLNEEMINLIISRHTFFIFSFTFFMIVYSVIARSWIDWQEHAHIGHIL